MDFVIELLATIIIESIPYVFRWLGACVRWVFLQKSFDEVLKMSGNLAVGLAVFVPLTGLAIFVLTR